MSQSAHIYHTYIRTTPQRLWQAITDGAITRQYFHGTRMEGDFTAGSEYRCYLRDGRLAVEGNVLEADPPRRLLITWHFLYAPDLAAQPPSHVLWEIEQRGDVCLLTVTHDLLDPLTSSHVSEAGGWPFILSNLKSLLETGRPLAGDVPAAGA
jgi:uncharacterized protein YndB with AHSA1/START domain